MAFQRRSRALAQARRELHGPVWLVLLSACERSLCILAKSSSSLTPYWGL